MAKLDPRVKEAWVGALLSGEYKQGKRQLRSKDDEFCCLGVLCDVLGLEWGVDTHSVHVINPDGSLSVDVLPEDVANEIGIRPNGHYPYAAYSTDGIRHSLARLNDSGATFEEIAHVIMDQF